MCVSTEDRSALRLALEKPATGDSGDHYPAPTCGECLFCHVVGGFIWYERPAGSLQISAAGGYLRIGTVRYRISGLEVL